jgi:hypothetical protein
LPEEVTDDVAASSKSAAARPSQDPSGRGAFAELASPQETLSGASRDPDEDKFFALALVASADRIVSRDPHILEVEGFTVPALTPALFLAWLRRGGS